MHLVHLTIAPDSIVSCLLDWTDSCKYVAGSTRNERLTELWENYRSYCEENGIGDRAQRRLFSVQTLTPDAPGFVEISQKKLNATAARYMIFWLANVAKSFALVHGADDDMRLPWNMCFGFPVYIIYILTHFWYMPNHLVEFYQGSAAAC